MTSRKLWIGIGVVLAAVWLLFLLTFFVRTGDAMVLMAGFPALLGVVNLVLIGISAVDALVRDDLSGTQRLIWLLIAVFVTPGIAVGAIAYLVLGRERTRDLFRDVHLGGSEPPQPPPQTPRSE